MGRFRRLGGFGVLAALFALVSLLCLLAAAWSPDRLLVTGHRVAAHQQGHTVSYTIDDTLYTLPAVGSGNPAKPTSVTVYVDPHHPEHGVVDSPWTWVPDVGLIGTPLLIGLVFFGLAVTGPARRERRRDSVRLSAAGNYGWGLDPEFVQRRLQRLRGGVRS